MNHVMTIASGQGIVEGSKQHATRGQKGFALIVSLLILLVLTLVAVTALRSSVVEEQVSHNQKLGASALFAAEQGVTDALNEMFAGTITDTGQEANVNWSDTGAVTGTGYRSDYTVRHLVRNGSQIEDDDGRRYFIIDSVGKTVQSNGTTTDGGARRTLEVGVALEWNSSSNVAGLIGCQGVTGLSNVQTGSYSSTGQPSDGDRGDVATTDAGAFMYLVGSSDFDIIGEVRSTGAIFMDSNALVRRDALANLRITVKSGDIYGSAWTNQNFYQCTSCVHGSIYQGPSVTPNPLVPLPACDPLDINAIFSGVAAIKGGTNNNGNIGISSGGNYSGSPSTIPAGDYYFSNFTLDGKTATVNGQVRIYVFNDFTMKSTGQLILGPNSSLRVYVEAGNAWIDSNSQVNHDPANFYTGCNPGGCPINMWLYSKRSNTPKDIKVTSSYDEPNVWDDSQDVAGVKLDSNSVYYGLIYAPLSHVVLGSNVTVYGSVRGRFVTGNSNFDFTYDEDLDTIWTGNPTDYKLVYWTEKYPE